MTTISSTDTGFASFTSKPWMILYALLHFVLIFPLWMASSGIYAVLTSFPMSDMRMLVAFLPACLAASLALGWYFNRRNGRPPRWREALAFFQTLFVLASLAMGKSVAYGLIMTYFELQKGNASVDYVLRVFFFPVIWPQLTYGALGAFGMLAFAFILTRVRERRARRMRDAQVERF